MLKTNRDLIFITPQSRKRQSSFLVKHYGDEKKFSKQKKNQLHLWTTRSLTYSSIQRLSVKKC
jgi:hypothetical protein